ncbi:class A beta-lactamase-related serine hydrolase [Paenibacillus sp. 1011MAR3C5]|uniref:serine hydrolase domain-containing protein n=1 Tax=Paenibacillus sp. 1011MAR3C5 TaxID=1675787 RepID=UPI000E6B5FBE|nr:serine hydrolase domain-containing protein [Paenibacillus sp. 1011MAR3C5]RJE90125.1 class A beta-lactamase-related serine hydrolase [Paenibacillus sp. 1011MAR3C5]
MMSTLHDKLADYMKSYTEQYPFSGRILLALHNEPIYDQSFGYASKEHGVPIQPETKFGIWSVTKSFTAMAVAMLAEEGLLRFDDPVSDYVPSLKAHGPMTIRQLLQHRSGLPNFTNMPEYNKQLNKWPLDLDRTLALLRDKPLDYPSGDSFAYNNTGYFMLGLIIEKVSGMTFESFVETRILQPLGMMDTGVNNGRSVIPNLASAYSSSGRALAPAEYIDMSTVTSAGGMYATAADLLKWDQALNSSRLISKELTDQAFGFTEDGYELGWFLDRRNGRRRISHSGAYRGFKSELHRYPDDGITVILLTNYDFVPSTKLAGSLADLMLGEEAIIPLQPPRYPMKPEEFELLKGVYEGFGCRAEVDSDTEGCYFIWNNREKHELYPVSPTEFRHSWHDLSYAFKHKDNGVWTFLGMKKRA